MLGPADEGSTVLLKARKHLPLDTAAPLRRLKSTATPLPEPQISHLLISKYESLMSLALFFDSGFVDFHYLHQNSSFKFKMPSTNYMNLPSVQPA
jgi:hypothetical protein